MTQWKPLIPNAPPAPSRASTAPQQSSSWSHSQQTTGRASAPAHSPPAPITAHSVVRLRASDISALRAEGEQQLLIAIYSFNALVGALLVLLVASNPELLISFVGGVLSLWLVSYISFRVLYWNVFGNSVRASETQYPAIYVVVRQAAEALGLKVTPTVFVLQGHGLVELFIAKTFSRRGMIILTSNLVDELSTTGDTRRLMMLVGRQLGHIAAGHFDYWLLKDVVGAMFLFVHAAYKRRCHLTADRLGMMIVGDLEESKAALTILTVGKTLQPLTSMAELREQHAVLDESWFAWFCHLFEQYPYMLDRIMALEEFDAQRSQSPVRNTFGQPVRSLGIVHYNIYAATIGNLVIGNHTTASAT